MDIPRIHENYPANLSLSKFAENSGRIGFIACEMLKQFLAANNWGLCWMLIAFAIFAGRKSFGNASCIILWYIFASHFILYATAYLIYPYKLPLLIPQTIDRLYLHILPLGFLIAIIHLGKMTDRNFDFHGSRR